MAVDLQQLQEIYRIESEVDQGQAGVKQLVQSRLDLIEGLPEYKALEEAKAAVEEAKARLKIAVRDTARWPSWTLRSLRPGFDLRDLREILSHTLVMYTQQTGKAMLKEHDRIRQIELRARISKRLLGQERVPIGINRQFGVHVPIPERRPEVKQAEVGEGE